MEFLTKRPSVKFSLAIIFLLSFFLSFLFFVFPVFSQEFKAEILSLSFSPSEPIILENVSMDIKVKNTGRSYADFKLELFITKEGKIKYRRTFSFGFEQGMSLSFSPSYLPDDIGEYEILAKLYDKNKLILYDSKILKFIVISEVGPFDLSMEVLTRNIRPREDLPVILRISNKGEIGTDVKVKVEIFCFDSSSLLNEFFVYLESKSSLDKLVSIPTCSEEGLHLISSEVILYNKTWISSKNQFFIRELYLQLFLKVPETFEIKQGESKVFDVLVENPSNSSVHDLKLVMEKLPLEWADIKPYTIVEIKPNETVLFIVNLSIPKDAQPIEYPIKMTAGSTEVLAKKDSTLKILAASFFPSPTGDFEEISLLEQFYQLIFSNVVLILFIFSLLITILAVMKIRKPYWYLKIKWKRKAALRKLKKMISKR